MSLDYLAIDIGGTNLKYGIVNRAGTLIEKHTTPTNEESLDAFVAQLKGIADEFKDRIKGVGISVPGKVDQNDGGTIHGGGVLQFLDEVNLPRLLDLDIPVAVENDGKSAALAELWLGTLNGVKDGAALVLGTGVGGGLIINGELYTGGHFQAGEVSLGSQSTSMTTESLVGRIGSAVMMVERVATALDLPDKHDGLAVFEAINAHDPVAWPIFEAYAEEIGLIIHNIQAIMDLDRFVIGGGISAQPIVVETINEAYMRIFNTHFAIRTTLTPPEILPSRFKNDANMYGAVYRLLLEVNQEV
ncbi:ROK family protein [Weissella ceti]|uniref:ROK family protein n=1 Tax=Weissella ceti TaxID=759620 RepID=A0ABT3E399_9LACO|nr:ROK family protein [Weissella ceti]MCW0952840.1 ROK family protein [Weissella ceti]QVK12537.1 ROK family protein [Weissella ceti]